MNQRHFYSTETLGYVLPLFGPSSFIVKWLCFKLKNRAFRVIQQYERNIYSERSDQE